VDSNQRFWVGSGTDLLVFDHRGRLVHKVGRTGDGPGEFRGISRIVCVPGDSVLVVDARLGRVSVFDPAGQFTRSIRIPERSLIFDLAVVRWPTDVVLNAAVFGETTIGWPLHVADFSGHQAQFKRSFGDNDGRYVFGQEQKLQRMIGGGSRTDFWAVPLYAIALKHWSVDGQELPRSFTLLPDWFNQRPEPMPLGNPSTPPARIVRGIWVDSEKDLIWTVVWIPRRDWAEAWKDIRPLPNRGEVNVSDLPAAWALWQTRIDVLDPRTAKSVANATTPLLLERVSSGGLAAAYVEAADGTPRVRIIRLTLTGQGER
jgi:hypothetical protein